MQSMKQRVWLKSGQIFFFLASCPINCGRTCHINLKYIGSKIYLFLFYFSYLIVVHTCRGKEGPKFISWSSSQFYLMS